MKNPKLVPITEEMKQEARKYAHYVAHNLKNKPNYTGLVIQNRYYFGYLGEQVVLVYLRAHSIPHEYSVKTNGESDGAEFTIYGKTIDVKTATKASYTRMMIPKRQLHLHPCDYYVGVRLNDDKGEIFGYCTGADLEPAKDFGYGVPTFSKPLQELKPIEEILSKGGE